MRKIFTIAQREYTSRVLTKIFWISVLLLPIGIVLMVLIPLLAASSIEKEKATIQVVEDSTALLPVFQTRSDTFVRYEKSPLSETEFHTALQSGSLKLKKGDILLAIPSSRIDSLHPRVELIYNGALSIQLQSIIESNVNTALQAYKLKKLGFEGDFKAFSARPVMEAMEVDDTGKISEGGAELAAIVGYAMAILNYLLVFIYGMMMLRGVVEEKTSRIVEVVLSSVKPFQLMAGKLIGICAVGLTQFMLWIALSFVGTWIAGSIIASTADPALIAQANQSAGMNFGSILSQLFTVLSPGLMICFAFYFLGGFLLFGSLFGAIGSAVDQEQDTQQLMWPVTVPLVIPMLLIGNVLMNPNGTLAVFLSIFPLSSPTIMMIRLAATDVPAWQVAASMGLLLIGIIGCIWLAARIYRTGILLYGKKATIRELLKWIVKS